MATFPGAHVRALIEMDSAMNQDVADAIRRIFSEGAERPYEARYRANRLLQEIYDGKYPGATEKGKERAKNDLTFAFQCFEAFMAWRNGELKGTLHSHRIMSKKQFWI